MNAEIENTQFNKVHIRKSSLAGHPRRQHVIEMNINSVVFCE